MDQRRVSAIFQVDFNFEPKSRSIDRNRPGFWLEVEIYLTTRTSTVLSEFAKARLILVPDHANCSQAPRGACN